MSAPFPTREDFFAVGARELLARQQSRPPGKRVTLAAIQTTGTNVNSALAGMAAMCDEVMRHTAIRFGELFLDSSEGESLARLVADHIDPDLIWKQPSRAVVPLTFERAIPPSDGSAYVVASGTIIRTATGVEFRTLADAAFPLNSVGPVGPIEAEAVLAGTIGNVDAGTLTQFAQQPNDSGISVTNATFASGGTDIETSQEFLTRARATRRSSRRGILGAIELGALSVTGVKTVVVEEDLDSNGEQTGLVRVYVADANGRSNSSLCALVRDALLEYRCCGIVPSVVATTPLFASISYSLPLLYGYDPTASSAQLKTLTIAAVNQLKPGEVLRRSLLTALARTVPGYVVGDVSILLPVVDQVPLSTQTIKTRADLILVNGA
jgi:hypothetical protein